MPDNFSNIDFEGNGNVNEPQNQNNQNDNNATSLNGDNNNVADLNNQNNNQNDNNQNNQNNQNNDGGGNNDNNQNNNDNNSNNNNNNNSSTGELKEGDQLNIDGVPHTVDANGNIVDPNGNIFVEAANVSTWLAEQNVTDDNDNNELTIDNIINAVGTDITDEEGNPIEFTNDAAGVRAYIDNVIELRTQEIQQATINKLYEDVPLVKDFIDYLTVNNGSPRGFGEIRDLSGVKLDKENEHQLETVIREAAKEFGNNSISDAYIKYLKDSGGLYDEANRQLQAIIEKDNAARTQREEQAKQIQEEQQARVQAYWASVDEKIKSRSIAGYQIPDTFVLERNGKKVTLTPNDFMTYLTYRDKETDMTGYQTDLTAMTEEQVMENELLDAWLHFTGKSYKDLIDMAVKEDKVRQLRIQSKQNNQQRTVTINRNNNNKKVDINSIILG